MSKFNRFNNYTNYRKESEAQEEKEASVKETYAYTIKDQYLNMRSQASLGSEILCVLDPNTKVQIVDSNCDPKWQMIMKLNSDGSNSFDYGFVLKEYLTIYEDK